MRAWTPPTTKSRCIILSAIVLFVLSSIACSKSGKSDAEKAQYLTSLLEATPYKTKPPSTNDGSNKPRQYYGLTKQPTAAELQSVLGTGSQENENGQLDYFWKIKGLNPADPTEINLVMAEFDANGHLANVIFGTGAIRLYGDAKKVPE